MKKYILPAIILVFLAYIVLADNNNPSFGAPSVNILGNRAVIGLTATTTANANLTASGTIAFVSLASSGNPCLIIGTDGTVATSTCGSGGISSINGSTSSTQIFATSTDTNMGITIGTADGTHTFTPVWIGTLADSRITSAATWNAKQAAITLASSTTGTDFTITNADPTWTFNLPSSSGSNRGLLTAADWTTFNGKQAALGFTPLDIAGSNNMTASLIVSGSATSTITGGGTASFIGGNLGIATSTAGSALTVQGNELLTGNLTHRGSAFSMKPNVGGSGPEMTIDASNVASSTGNAFVVMTNDVGVSFTFGIGRSGLGSNAVTMRHNGTSTLDDIIIRTNGNNDRLTITKDGLIQIGTGGSANAVTCFKADAKSIGYCSDAPGAGGTCTCL